MVNVIVPLLLTFRPEADASSMLNLKAFVKHEHCLFHKGTETSQVSID